MTTHFRDESVMYPLYNKFATVDLSINCPQNLKATAPHQVIQNIKGQLRTHNPNLLQM